MSRAYKAKEGTIQCLWQTGRWIWCKVPPVTPFPVDNMLVVGANCALYQSFILSCLEDKGQYPSNKWFVRVALLYAVLSGLFWSSSGLWELYFPVAPQAAKRYSRLQATRELDVLKKKNALLALRRLWMLDDVSPPWRRFLAVCANCMKRKKAYEKFVAGNAHMKLLCWAEMVVLWQ